MPAFSGQFNWNVGLIWQVGFMAGTVQSTRIHVCPALVDTGATRTCIAKSVVEALQLQPISKTEMQTAGGLVAVNVYNVHVALVFSDKQKPDGSQSSQAQLTDTQALEFDPGGTAYQGLIGRDILRLGVLNVSHDGHFSFAY